MLKPVIATAAPLAVNRVLMLGVNRVRVVREISRDEFDQALAALRKVPCFGGVGKISNGGMGIEVPAPDPLADPPAVCCYYYEVEALATGEAETATLKPFYSGN